MAEASKAHASKALRARDCSTASPRTRSPRCSAGSGVRCSSGASGARGSSRCTLPRPAANAAAATAATPSFERAQEFYNSQEYQAAKKVRAGAATAQFVLVEGM